MNSHDEQVAKRLLRSHLSQCVASVNSAKMYARLAMVQTKKVRSDDATLELADRINDLRIAGEGLQDLFRSLERSRSV